MRPFSTACVMLIALMTLAVAGPVRGQAKKSDRASGRAKAAASEPVVPGRYLTTSDTDRTRAFDDIRRITLASGADLLPFESQHVTLWAAKDLRNVFLPDVQKLEKFLETKFDEPLRSGLDKRSAHILLIRRRYEYERWVSTMFDVLGDRFRQADNPNAVAEQRAWALKSQGYVPHDFAVFCLEGQPGGWSHRVVAVGLGYMSFTQLTDRNNPALAAGFANGIETALTGSPGVMLFSNSYPSENRNLGVYPRAWIHLVQQRIASRQSTPPGQLLQMDSSTMQLPQYAEAWSLVALLAKQPAEFGKLVLALRDDPTAMKAIEQVYGWDEKRLIQQWHRHVSHWDRRTAAVGDAAPLELAQFIPSMERSAFFGRLQ